MIFAVPEDISVQARSSMEQALKFAETAGNTVEELFELNLKTARAASADALSQLKALATAKDVQELGSLHTSFAQANAEKLFGYSRAVYGWSAEAQGEISKLVEVQIAEINKAMAAAVDRAAKAAPSGSEFAFAAVKSAMSAANQAYDAFSKVGKQVAEATEATINTTSGAARKKAA